MQIQLLPIKIDWHPLIMNYLDQKDPAFLIGMAVYMAVLMQKTTVRCAFCFWIFFVAVKGNCYCTIQHCNEILPQLLKFQLSP